MPELIEVEMYRRALDPVIGGTIEAIELPDRAYLRPVGVSAAALDDLVGLRLDDTRRVGKLLLLDLVDDGDAERARTIGLRFGMTGRMVVQGAAPIETLEYSSDRDDPAWDRVIVHTSVGTFSVRDPRRLGNIDLEPADAALGPDAASITKRQLRAALAGRTAPLKALLMNQSAIAGLGNLLVDEVLWRARLSPHRVAGELTDEELTALRRAIVQAVRVLSRRGGSHTGDTFPERRADGVCPRDGAPMRRDRVGGRTTWWCPEHQH